MDEIRQGRILKNPEARGTESYKTPGSPDRYKIKYKQIKKVRKLRILSIISCQISLCYDYIFMDIYLHVPS